MATGIRNGGMTHRQRIRSGARAINNTIRRVVRRRYELGTVTRVRHVRAHTGGSDRDSRFNDQADALAKEASRMEGVRKFPYTMNDETVLFYTKRWNMPGRPFVYVSGDLRGALKRLVRGAQQVKWNSCSGSQAEFPRSCGDDIQNYCEWVRRLRNRKMFRFAVMAALSILPTPALTASGTAGEVAEAARSCPLCDMGAEATLHHVLTCPYVQEVARPNYSRVLLPRDRSPALRFDRGEVGSYHDADHQPLYWFRGDRGSSDLDLPTTDCVPVDMWRAFVRQHKFCRLTGGLGGIPMGARRLITWMYPGVSLSEVDDVISRVRLECLSSYVLTYQTYQEGLRRWVATTATMGALQGIITCALTPRWATRQRKRKRNPTSAVRIIPVKRARKINRKEGGSRDSSHAPHAMVLRDRSTLQARRIASRLTSPFPMISSEWVVDVPEEYGLDMLRAEVAKHWGISRPCEPQ